MSSESSQPSHTKWGSSTNFWKPHSTKWTLNPFSAIFVLSVIRIQSSKRTTSVIIFVIFFPNGYGRCGLCRLPRRWKYVHVQKDVSGRPPSCFSHRQLKRILDDTFGFVFIFSWSNSSRTVICILALSDKRRSNCFIWNSIPIEREQVCFCKAVTHCCCFERTTISASQQSKVIAVRLRSRMLSQNFVHFFLPIFLQWPVNTNIQRLQQMCSMRLKCYKMDAIVWYLWEDFGGYMTNVWVHEDNYRSVKWNAFNEVLKPLCK